MASERVVSSEGRELRCPAAGVRLPVPLLSRGGRTLRVRCRAWPRLLSV